MKDMNMEERKAEAEQHQGAGNTLSAASASEPTHEMSQSRATPTPANRRASVSFACDNVHNTSTANDHNLRGGRSDEGYEEFLALLASPSNHEDMSSATPSPLPLSLLTGSSSSSSIDTLSIAEEQEPRTVPSTSEKTNADGEHDVSALAAARCQGKSRA